MAWKDQIPGCFGTIDQNFSVHPLDEQRAIKLLLAVKEELVPYEEVEKAIKVYLAEKNASGEHIDEQLARVQELFKPWF